MVDMICIYFGLVWLSSWEFRSNAIVADRFLNSSIGHADAGYIGRWYIECEHFRLN